MKILKATFGILAVTLLSPLYLAVFAWWFIAERLHARRTRQPSNPCGHVN